MKTKDLLFVSLVVVLLLVSTPASAQVAPVDCSNELIACTHNGEVVAVNINNGSARLLSTYPAGGGPPNGGGGGGGGGPSGFGTEIEYDFNTDEVWLESVNGALEIIEIDILTGTINTTTIHGGFSLAGMEYIGTTLYSMVINLNPVDGGGGSTFATFDTSTGIATPIGPSGIPAPINGLAIHPTTDVLYGVTAGGAPASLVTIDVGTGLATIVGPIGTGAANFERIGSIEFGPDGLLYGATTDTGIPNPSALITIDPATGAPTLVGTTGYSITGLAACEVVPVELMRFTVD